FFSSRRRHTRSKRDWSSDVCSSDLERCMAAAVVTVQEGIYDDFMKRLKEEAENIVMGNGLDDGVFLGPVIREENKDRTINYIEEGKKEGANILLDGREKMPEDGYFVGPTIFEDV